MHLWYFYPEQKPIWPIGLLATFPGKNPIWSSPRTLLAFRACEQSPAARAMATMATNPTMMMASPADSSMWPKAFGGGGAAAVVEVCGAGEGEGGEMLAWMRVPERG